MMAGITLQFDLTRLEMTLELVKVMGDAVKEGRITSLKRKRATSGGKDQEESGTKRLLRKSNARGRC